jgi:hypothetical protein
MDLTHTLGATTMVGLKAGQRLVVRKRSELLKEDATTLDRLRIDRAVSIYVTLVDDLGVSLYICRYPGNLEAFIPTGGVGLTNLGSFFEPAPEIHPGYVSYTRRHYTRVFPKDF